MSGLQLSPASSSSIDRIHDNMAQLTNVTDAIDDNTVQLMLPSLCAADAITSTKQLQLFCMQVHTDMPVLLPCTLQPRVTTHPCSSGLAHALTTDNRH